MSPRPPSTISTFISELRERRVMQVVFAYLAIAWMLMQVADVVLPALGAPAWTVTFVIVLLILGFPLAVALAWVFDVGPSGIERTDEVRARDIAALHTAVATVPAGVTAPGTEPVITRRPVSPGPAPSAAPAAGDTDTRSLNGAVPSVAVLPFVDLSPDQDQEYFADGLTEELLNVLTRVPGLRVPARTSSFAFKGRNAHVREIGEALAVRTVLEGSVRTWERQVLITARLSDVEDGFQLWSDTYKAELADIFRVQEEIAGSIARTLKGKLLGEGDSPRVSVATENTEAYRLYLRGRHVYNRSSMDNLQRARELFQQAIDRDPGFARAWVGLADVWWMLAYRGVVAPREALTSQRLAAERAIELDPTLSDAYVSRSYTYPIAEFAAAERDLRRALELKPTCSHARNSQGLLTMNLCRPREAIEMFRGAAEIDPLWPVPSNNMAMAFESLGRLHDALEAAQHALDLAADGTTGLDNLAGILSALGRHEEAVATARDLHDNAADPSTASVLATCLFNAGQPEEANDLLLELERLHGEGKASALHLSSLYGLTGRHDEAFSALEEAIAGGEPATTHLAAAARHDSLREDPRWDAVLARAGFPDDVIRRGRDLYEGRGAARAGVDASRAL